MCTVRQVVLQALQSKIRDRLYLVEIEFILLKCQMLSIEILKHKTQLFTEMNTFENIRARTFTAGHPPCCIFSDTPIEHSTGCIYITLSSATKPVKGNKNRK